MAQPSSSHHGERHHRSERSRERSHHHHRTISSTTLLLVLSLVLAVLAVMLSLPSSSSSSEGGSTSGVMSYFTPKRTQALIAREGAVAVREAEVARREAEILVGAPGGVIKEPPPPMICPPCAAHTTFETIAGPIQTVIKEVVKEDSLTPPGWIGTRSEELLDRELKIAEREREISKREEVVNRREHDASRREAWIMEQLIAMGNDTPQTVEEEVVYEQPRRKAKLHQELPPIVVAETQYETETKVVVQTSLVTAPPPANTRIAAFPSPDVVGGTPTPSPPRTTAVEVITEEEEEDDDMEPVNVRVPPRPRPTRRPPSNWYSNEW